MNKENTEYLFNNYPLLYRDKDKSMRETLMCFGFDCGDGWFKIIDELSHKIETKLRELVKGGIDRDKLPKASQVKEKFGQLRFYMYGRPMFEDEIREAERLSSITCEKCGDKGKLRDDVGWIRTLCVLHYREKLEHIVNRDLRAKFMKIADMKQEHMKGFEFNNQLKSVIEYMVDLEVRIAELENNGNDVR